MNTFEWMHRMLAEPISALLKLSDAVRDGGTDPKEMRQHLKEVIMRVNLDATGASAGLNERYVLFARDAFVALFDELSRRRGSSCDYSQVDNLLQREFMDTENAGKIFFENLDSLLQEKGKLDISLHTRDALSATIAVHTTCMSLGFRGIYAGHGLEDFATKYKEARNASGAAFNAAAEAPPPHPQSLGRQSPSRRSRQLLPLLILAASVCAASTIVSLYIDLSSESNTLARRLNTLLDKL